MKINNKNIINQRGLKKSKKSKETEELKIPVYVSRKPVELISTPISIKRFIEQKIFFENQSKTIYSGHHRRLKQTVLHIVAPILEMCIPENDFLSINQKEQRTGNQGNIPPPHSPLSCHLPLTLPFSSRCSRSAHVCHLAIAREVTWACK